MLLKLFKILSCLKTLLCQYINAVPNNWYLKPPWLPLISKKWIRFRLTTMYGAQGMLTFKDLISYLDWVRRYLKAK